MAKRNTVRQGRKPENRYMAAMRRLEIAEPLVRIEKYGVAEDPTHAKDQFQNETMSNMNLPSPPLFNGNKFDFWSSRMRAYLWSVDKLVEVNDEARDALFLHLFQQALDESMLHKIAATKTSKEALSILEGEFSERGSNQDEALIVAENEVAKGAYEKVKDSVIQAEHDHIENSEAYNADAHVDDEGDVETSEAHKSSKSMDDDSEDEESASHAVLHGDASIQFAENMIEFDNEKATQEVAGQPLEVEIEAEKEAATTTQIGEDELMKSLPMRAENFHNSVFNYECAGIRRNQPVNERNEEKIAQAKYDKETLSDKELQKMKKEISFIVDLLNGKAAEIENSVEDNTACVENEIEEYDEDCNFIAEIDKIVEDCTEGAGIEETIEGIHVYAMNETKSSIEAATKMNEKLNEKDGSHIAARDEVKNSLRGEKNENSQYGSKFNTSYKISEINNGQLAEHFESLNDDGRTKPKKPEESLKMKRKKKTTMKKTRFMKNRAKKKVKKQTRKVPEFKIWSPKKKKKLHW